LDRNGRRAAGAIFPSAERKQAFTRALGKEPDKMFVNRAVFRTVPGPRDGGAAQADHSPCTDQLDTGCNTDLFVQLMTVSPTVPKSHDFPEVQKILREKPDYRGVRLVVAHKPGKDVEILAAVVRNRCQADRLTEDANASLKTGAGSLCMPLDVVRTVYTVR
jgi:hypothetical protein